MSETKPAFFQYKEKPLVRNGNTLYYGDMNDPYVVMLQINSTRKLENIDNAADKITVSLMATDPATPPQEIIVKSTEKVGLYNAMDIASIWLERALQD